MQTVIEYSSSTANGFSDSNNHFLDLERICLDSLRYEVMAWPKPGLVSPVDSGSHSDMHLGTFFSSIDALQGSFVVLASAGARGFPFAALQSFGIEAERKMLKATGGVNTHRGAIFNLGLLVAAAAGRMTDSGLKNFNCGEVVTKLWGAEILSGRDKSPDSHGNQAFEKYETGGARMEAASGFPTVYKIGLPVLQKLLENRHDRETALIGTLLTLMEHLSDTNLLWRGGKDGLDFVHRSAANFNFNGGVEAPHWQSRLLTLHREFVARNLSPGGSADLVAATWVVHQIETIIKRSI